MITLAEHGITIAKARRWINAMMERQIFAGLSTPPRVYREPRHISTGHDARLSGTFAGVQEVLIQD